MTAARPIVDLTRDESTATTIVGTKTTQDTVDLTDDDPQPKGDHMGSVAKMLSSDRVIGPVATTDQLHASSLSLVDIEYISSGEDEPAPTTERKGKPIHTFPFLSLPAEIRNSVYRLLLTRPPKESIELPKPTSRAAKARSVIIRDCKTAKQRKAHKQLFLEILATCHQIHNEASSIIYGCNVFKYRPHLGDANLKPILPTRHLQLIKHIKLAVIGGANACRKLEKRIADFIACFISIQDLRLETFELVWYSWEDYVVTASGPLNQALLSMQVERQMILRFTGSARLQVSMKVQLEDKFTPARAKVCIGDRSLTIDEVESV